MNNNNTNCIEDSTLSAVVIGIIVFILIIAICSFIAFKVVPNTVERDFYLKYKELLPAYKIYLEERISGRTDIELNRLSRFLTESDISIYTREASAKDN